MKKRDDAVYLKHILDAIARVEEYIQGIDSSSFAKKFLV